MRDRNDIAFPGAFMLALTLVLAPVRANAAGTSGSLVPTSVHVEGGNVYVSGAFQNPDQCAASSIVVLFPANAQELDRMTSMAMTAVASGKKISMWLSGCAPVPWYASAPRAVTMALGG